MGEEGVCSCHKW